MKTRKTKWLTRLGLLAGVLATGWWIYSRVHPEPAYEGKTVSELFKDCCRWSDITDWSQYRQEELTLSLQAIGTNAVPYLLEQAFQKEHPSPVWSNVLQIVDRYRRWRRLPPLVSAEIMREMAPNALSAIKPPISQILPTASRYLNSTNVSERQQALRVLATAGDGETQTVPYLEAGLKDPNPEIRATAAAWVAFMGSRATAAVPALIELLKASPETNHLQILTIMALGKIGGSNAAPAVPILRQYLERETNSAIRTWLAGTLLRIDPGQREALPILIGQIQSRHGGIELVIHQLAEIGPAARGAAPILIQLLNDTNTSYTWNVPKALVNMGIDTNLFLLALKAQMNSPIEANRFDSASWVLKINPADHDAQLTLMKLIEQSVNCQNYAIDKLGNAGPSAAEALPLLRRVAKESTDRDTKEKAQRAIKKIEAIPKATD